MPSHQKAAMRTTEYQIAGRDGKFHVNEGFDSFQLRLVLRLIRRTAGYRQIINAWADGTGKLILSDDPSKAYMATVIKGVRWQRDIVGGTVCDTAEITFDCQPVMVEAVDTVITLTDDDTIINPGNVVAYPTIEVNGAGDVSFSIGEYEIGLSGLTANVPVYIDSANGYVYTGSGATSMVGEFPVIGLESTDVTIGSGITSLVITPHWGWI
jgi:phage-related protein